MLLIQPGGEHLHNPKPLGRTRRVAGENDSTPLIELGGPNPGHDELDLSLAHGGGLIHDEEVVRTASPRFLVTRVPEAPKLDMPVVPSEVLVLPVRTHGADYLTNTIGDFAGLLDFLADDKGLLVLRQRTTRGQVGLTTPASTTVEQDVS